MIMTIIQSFSAEIQKLADDLPVALALQVSQNLEQEKIGDWSGIRLSMLQHIHNPRLGERVRKFCEIWEKKFSKYAPQSVALSLITTVRAIEVEKRREILSLVWTGPESENIPLRRTEQVLLQLICEAKEQLLLVSFAIYKAEEIMQALEDAIRRGVKIILIIETPLASNDKISFDPLQHFSKLLRENVDIYAWPLENRLLSEDGKHGSLHAKVAVADSHTAFITSANLTDYAMNLNMEMGTLIKGGDIPYITEKHFVELLNQGIIVLIG